jgi:hypothetical protein
MFAQSSIKYIHINDITDIKAILFFDKIREKYKLNDNYDIASINFINTLVITSSKFRYFKMEYELISGLYCLFLHKGDLHRTLKFENNDDMFNVADMIINVNDLCEYTAHNKFNMKKHIDKCIIVDSIYNDSIFFIDDKQCIRFSKKIIFNNTILYNREIKSHSGIIHLYEVGD